MTHTIITSFDVNQFKAFLKETIREVIAEGMTLKQPQQPQVMTIQEAAKFLRLKIATVYEKTSRRLIPHFKKGNKLYFNQEELQNWIADGKITTHQELETKAATYTLTNKK